MPFSGKNKSAKNATNKVFPPNSKPLFDTNDGLYIIIFLLVSLLVSFI